LSPKGSLAEKVENESQLDMWLTPVHLKYGHLNQGGSEVPRNNKHSVKCTALPKKHIKPEGTHRVQTSDKVMNCKVYCEQEVVVLRIRLQSHQVHLTMLQ